MTTSLKDKNTDLTAKKWAKALIELAGEDENVSKESILSELKDVTETVNSSEELINVINNPSISVEEKQIVLCKLFQNRTMPIVYNFIFVLNLRRRLNIISEITAEFEKEVDKLNNIANISVTSAIDLSEEKKSYIKKNISEKLHKEVRIDWNTDKDIIAGLVLDIDETVVDNSIRGRLQDLSKIIIKG